MNRSRLAPRLALANGVARSALGVVALVAPVVPLRPWVGAAADEPAPVLLGRALGGRDLAIGLGTLGALAAGAPLRGWSVAAGVADAGDVATTLAAFGRLPRTGRWLVLAAASGGVAVAILTVAAGPQTPSGGGGRR